ncbi:transposase [Actinomadura coerulea]|uniref:transposase n=1 Tax=Actinomadura coerulea TaxID=46159 RepID=UPI0034340650
MPKPYPPEFRRRALDLLESGRSVRDVAAALGIAESCLHRWKRRDLIERGLKPLSPAEAESAALAQARAAPGGRRSHGTGSAAVVEPARRPGCHHCTTGRGISAGHSLAR